MGVYHVNVSSGLMSCQSLFARCCKNALTEVNASTAGEWVNKLKARHRLPWRVFESSTTDAVLRRYRMWPRSIPRAPELPACLSGQVDSNAALPPPRAFKLFDAHPKRVLMLMRLDKFLGKRLQVTKPAILARQRFVMVWQNHKKKKSLRTKAGREGHLLRCSTLRRARKSPGKCTCRVVLRSSDQTKGKLAPKEGQDMSTELGRLLLLMLLLPVPETSRAAVSHR